MPRRLSHIKFRIDGIEVSAVKSVLNKSESFAETLEVDDFTLTKEADRVYDIRVIGKTQNVIVGKTGFLLRSHIFTDIGNGITGYRKGGSRSRSA